MWYQYLLYTCRVHADKSDLQNQLSQLKLQQQQDLQNLENRFKNSSGQVHVGQSGPSGVGHTGDQSEPLATTSGDARQLVEHEVALQRLVELQKTMIGGERAGKPGCVCVCVCVCVCKGDFVSTCTAYI